MPVAQIEGYQDHIWRELQQNGVSYNVQIDNQPDQRRWSLDPVPVIYSAAEWTKIEAGLTQRAKLMDLLLADLYGERRLIRDGLLPQELIYRHSGFMRSCDGLYDQRDQHLTNYAASFTRDSDGQHWVINDYSEAPHGSGYALENRSIIADTLPDTFASSRVRRLVGYFRRVKQSLVQSARTTINPRIVLLSSGVDSPSYFEQAYLATYLGITLVQSGDLTVRNRHVFLKSLGGLEKVDVIFRFVASATIDPLAIPQPRGGGLSGITGLVEAVRAGTVVVVNPIGAEVLENPGLLGYLYGISEELLGEELLLPHVATWWCGAPKACRYVIERLDQLVIKSIDRRLAQPVIFGSRLSKEKLADLKARILADPGLFVAQDQAHYSSAPSVIDNALEPRLILTRAFATSDGTGSYSIMPGALVKTTSDPTTEVVSTLMGAESKDAWIEGERDRSEDFVSMWDQDAAAITHTDDTHLPSRSGENLFWTGRNTTRCAVLVRTLRHAIAVGSFNAIPSQKMRRDHLRYLIDLINAVMNTPVEPASTPALETPPTEQLTRLLTDPLLFGSLPYSLRALEYSSFNVKDIWSQDTSQVLANLKDFSLSATPGSTPFFQEAEEAMGQLITNINAFVGLGLESMTRNAGWHLLDIGRRVEQAQLVVSVLRHGMTQDIDESLEPLNFQALLASLDSLVTYRRTYRVQGRADLVLQLMLLDTNNPRSLIYQALRIKEHLAGLPGDIGEDRQHWQLVNSVERLLDIIDTMSPEQMQTVDPTTPHRAILADMLDSITSNLTEIGSCLEATYFLHADAFEPVE